MIGVLGATGNTGRAVAAELRKADADFKCIVRNLDKAKEVLGDINTVLADIDDLPSLSSALQGIECLFIVTGHHPGMAAQLRSVFETAKAAGVRHIVKVSGGAKVALKHSESVVGRAHYESDSALKELGVGWTILRPGLFMQNVFSQIPLIKAEGKAVMPFAPDLPLALIDVRDIGTVGAQITLHPENHNNKVYAFSGHLSSMGQLVKAISDVIGKEITYVGATLDQAENGMKAKGMPDWLVEHMLTIAKVGEAGGFSDANTNLINEIAGVDPRTIEDFAKDHAELFK